MHHLHSSEQEHRDHETYPARRGEPEQNPSWFFGLTTIVTLFALWFFLFADVHRADDIAPPTASRKMETVSLRSEGLKTFAPRKETRPKNGEERALLLYLLRVFDGRSVSR